MENICFFFQEGEGLGAEPLVKHKIWEDNVHHFIYGESAVDYALNEVDDDPDNVSEKPYNPFDCLTQLGPKVFDIVEFFFESFLPGFRILKFLPHFFFLLSPFLEILIDLLLILFL